MDIKDFEGLTKFKVIIPTLYVCSWISMLFGPVFFPGVYNRICAFFIIFIAIKVSIYFTIMLIVTYKSHQVFKRVQNPAIVQQPGPRVNFDVSGQQINYGFILPNYMEDVEMIAQTLDILAAHTRAKHQYIILLAMEAHQQDSQLKAKQLIERYSNKFRVVDFTQHQVRQFQQKGKASNVSWCAQHLEPILQKYMINPDSVFLTIIDADSWAPNVYFDIMEEQILKNYEKRYTIMFQPPQIFTRNNLQVPIFTRVYDIMHSFAHCSNLYSVFDLTFPLSNYSLSYNLIKRIGFWDTCADAIGEDFHTTQKAYWKTEGQFFTIPIYAPFNQINISTGKGYKQDVLARFWQAERHAQGVADVAYQFKMLLTHKFKPMNFVVFYHIVETFCLPAFLPWIFISMMLQSFFLYRGVQRPDYLVSPLLFSIFFNLMTVASTVGYFLLEVMKRKANKLLYHQQNQSLLRIIEYPLIFMVNLFSIGVPTFVISAFSTLMGKRQYVVAQKKYNHNKK